MLSEEPLNCIPSWKTRKFNLTKYQILLSLIEARGFFLQKNETGDKYNCRCSLEAGENNIDFLNYDNKPNRPVAFFAISSAGSPVSCVV